MGGSNTDLLGVPEGNSRENGGQAIFQDNKGDFPELMKATNLSRLNNTKFSTRHSTV